MMQSGALSNPHYVKGLTLGRYTAANLRQMAFFRDRVGWKVAFLEDGVLTGLLAARGVRGQTSRLKAVVLAEAKEDASKKKTQQDRDMAARQLVGPRGGLPSLRADLVKLAVLLHQEVGAKDTVAQLQAKCRPLVQAMMARPIPKESSSSTSAYQVSSAEATAPSVNVAEPPRTPQSSMMSSWSMPSEIEKEAFQKAILKDVEVMLAKQGEQFQTMMSQGMQHVMSVQNQSLPLEASPVDLTMEEAES